MRTEIRTKVEMEAEKLSPGVKEYLERQETVLEQREALEGICRSKGFQLIVGMLVDGAKEAQERVLDVGDEEMVNYLRGAYWAQRGIIDRLGNILSFEENNDEE